MRKIKKLEARIKMLECGVNRGHSYCEGDLIYHGHSISVITLKCLRCNYKVTKPISALNEKEKEAAIKLGLIPKESNDH